MSTTVEIIAQLHELIEAASPDIFEFWREEDTYDDLRKQEAEAQANLRKFLFKINLWDAKTIFNSLYVLVGYDDDGREISTGMSALTRGIYNKIGWSNLKLFIQMGSNINEKLSGEFYSTPFEFYMIVSEYCCDGIPVDGVRMFVDYGAKITSKIFDMAVDYDKTTEEDSRPNFGYCFYESGGKKKKVLLTPYLLSLPPPNG
jgi:hypothetical protein